MEVLGMEIIDRYSRAQAIEDGVLVDVSDVAREAGFQFPVALTQAVWAEYVAVPDGVKWQDESGRLWDILWMLRDAISKSGGEPELQFSLHVNNSNTWGAKTVELKAVCGPGDDGEPVITVMLLDED